MVSLVLIAAADVDGVALELAAPVAEPVEAAAPVPEIDSTDSTVELKLMAFSLECTGASMCTHKNHVINMTSYALVTPRARTALVHGINTFF